ncbi:hypothetical protein CSIM01_05021 [Colletotrichum simmondsii]|uniref:Uncharacterized protein n=1 Tax=Colletotrichum simmondsii TaxID=703756 RepID=A0A135SKX4_9PEZI|nr:hypothetical protein CSIM01_05021 [Colletotrichum simmondsii]
MHPHLAHITPFTFSPGKKIREQMEQGPAFLLSPGGWSSRLVVHTGGGRDGGGDGGQSFSKECHWDVGFPISGVRQDIWVTHDVDYAGHGIADEPDSSNRQTRLAFKLNERSIDPACWENRKERKGTNKNVCPV